MPWKKALKFVAIAPAVVGISAIAMFSPTASAADFVCRGAIHRAHGDNIVFYGSLESQYGLRTGSGISQRTDHRGISRSSGLRFDRTNDQGQRIYRGNVAGMADVTLINLSEFVQPPPGGQISVNLDGQWGRGTCSNHYNIPTLLETVHPFFRKPEKDV